MLSPILSRSRLPTVPTMCGRRFSTLPGRCSHSNPLGLPPSSSPTKGIPTTMQTSPRAAALMKRGLPEKKRLPNVTKIVAVSSAKGGVGKSTISANLALAFAKLGFTTGILDADIFGPSIPSLFNLSGEPRLTPQGQLIPMTNYGVATMSIGYLVGGNEARESTETEEATTGTESPTATPGFTAKPPSPVAWRGLMLTQALRQLLHSTAWPALQILVIDLPPGTGDIHLTIGQQLVIDGAIVVSTPQHLSTLDAARGLGLLQKLDIPVIGVVQNMSMFVCPGCGTETRVFGGAGSGNNNNNNNNDGNGNNNHLSHDHHNADAKTLPSPWPQSHPLAAIPFLADIPLDPSICEHADAGKPTVVARPHSPAANVYLQLARKVGSSIGLL